MSRCQRRRSCRANRPEELTVFYKYLLIVQVVGHGDDEEEDNQRAAHGHNLLAIAWVRPGAVTGTREVTSQEGIPRNRQAQPDEIESQFHR